VRKAVSWWGLTLLIAAIFGLSIHRWLQSRPKQPSLRLARIEIPQTWSELPITARLTDVAVTSSSTGCGEGEGYGSVDHEGRLGRFRVRWSVVLYKGIDAGGQGWSVEAPEVEDACSPPRGPEVRVQLERPDTLREDSAAGIYVFEGHGQAMAACRGSNTVASPAHDGGARVRAATAGLIALLVFVASAALRRRISAG
jgi:hypothetical protein